MSRRRRKKVPEALRAAGLDIKEFRRFHDRFLPQPVSVALPGYGTVHLRMAHGVYPYVGVDFGGGANAFFDPRTMICTYSD